MRVFLSFGENNARGPWLLAFLLLALGWLQPQAARATHLRAGDIQAKVDTITGNPSHIFFRLTIYKDVHSPVAQDLANTTIFFGDGTALNGSDRDGSGRPLMTKVANVAGSTADTEIDYFYFDHNFPGAGSYLVSFAGENRVDGVVNMSNSVNQTFYISTRITIDPSLGRNHSPVLLAPAIDKAALGQVFLHNPTAYDADGDSLSYKLKESQQAQGGVSAAISNGNTPFNVICTNFRFPADQTIVPGAKQVAFPGSLSGDEPVGDPTANAIFNIDVHTGQITWNAPARIGYYNVAFLVEEWRRSAGGRRLIGQVIRDMQIIVSATNNLPPKLTVPADVCVVANQKVTLTVSATDGVSTNPPTSNVTLFAYSGTFAPSQPAATFKQNNQGTTVTGTYEWTPDCSKVGKEPYLVLFKAQDTAPNTTVPVLIDEKTVRITVVGPPPQNVRGVPASSAGNGLVSVVTWNSYTCQNASQLLIFRKEGPSNFNPGPCETGIPASAGYTQVGAVAASATSFTDDNGGKGLTRGKTYCYRIYATFPLPAGGASIASAETCVSFNGRSAMLTNVDVNTTNATTGQIAVKWTQPKADQGTFGAPAGYRLSRSIGAGAPTLVATITNLTDTTFVDSGLNTVANQYTYTLVFFNTDRTGATPVEKTETSPTATSVRTSLVPDGLAKAITVTWAYQVPWDNSQQPSRIYRQDPGTSTFTQIATLTPSATSGTYVDRDPKLQAGQQYCYYVQTNGQYAGYSFLTNLLNKSQQVCTTLLSVPCTPVLSLQVTNCDSLSSLTSYPALNQTYQNNLRWTTGNAPSGCQTNAAYYCILRSDTEGGTYVLIDSTTQLTYVDRNQPRPSYCYKVQAVAANGQRSGVSNSACQSDCVFFILPNIFIPGSSNTLNQVFRPKVSSPLLRTHIQIFNRWGTKVYESDQDPYINWTGGGVSGESTTSGLASGGIYYYLAEVEFADAAKTKRTYKGWVELVR